MRAMKALTEQTSCCTTLLQIVRMLTQIVQKIGFKQIVDSNICYAAESFKQTQMLHNFLFKDEGLKLSHVDTSKIC